MKSSRRTAVRVEPLRAAEFVPGLGKEETISTFAVDAVRCPADFRQGQSEFHMRGEAAWREYLHTGIAHPLREVAGRIQARIDARRREIQSDSR